MRYLARNAAIVVLIVTLILGLGATGAVAQGFGSCKNGVCPIKNFFGLFGPGLGRPGPGVGGFAIPGVGLPGPGAGGFAIPGFGVAGIAGIILVVLSLASLIGNLVFDRAIISILVFFFGVWGGVELGRYLEHFLSHPE